MKNILVCYRKNISKLRKKIFVKMCKNLLSNCLYRQTSTISEDAAPLRKEMAKAWYYGGTNCKGETNQ